MFRRPKDYVYERETLSASMGKGKGEEFGGAIMGKGKQFNEVLYPVNAGEY